MHFMQFDTIGQLILIGLVVERLTEIIVESKIAEPIRKYISTWATIDPRFIDPEKPLPKSAVFKEYVSYFVKCGYCMSVWVGAALGIIFPFRFFDIESDARMIIVFTWLVNFMVTTMLYHGVANWLHVAFKRAQVGVVDVKDLKVSVEVNRDVPV